MQWGIDVLQRGLSTGRVTVIIRKHPTRIASRSRWLLGRLQYDRSKPRIDDKNHWNTEDPSLSSISLRTAFAGCSPLWLSVSLVFLSLDEVWWLFEHSLIQRKATFFPLERLLGTQCSFSASFHSSLLYRVNDAAENKSVFHFQVFF